MRYRINKKHALVLIKIIDFIGYTIFRLFKKSRKDIVQDKIKKILIIRLDNLGDVILATPFIKAVKRNFPNAKIDILIKSLTKDILINNPHLNKIITFEPFWMGSSKPFNFFQIIGSIKKLRKEKYNIIFELRGNPFNILFASLIGSKYRIGYGAQGLGFLLTHLIDYDIKQKHEIERNLDILRILNFKIHSKKPEIFLSKKDEKFAEVFFKKNKINKKDLVVCIHPGAPWFPKRWPKERFAELADKLIEKYKAKIILIGSEDEIKLTNRIINLLKEKNKKNIFNIAGKTTTTQLTALIKKCCLFIGNDSGPMHIAATVNIPIIAFFGPSDPRLFGSYGKNNVIIYKKVECSPCIQRVNRGCKFDFPVCKGLLKINTEDVLEVVEKIRTKKTKWPTY